MTSRLQTKAAALAVLMCAALFGFGQSTTWTADLWLRLGIVAFGAFNVLASIPGTLPVRAVTIVASSGVLMFWPNGVLLFLIFGWLAWPPAFMVAASLGRPAAEGSDARPADTDRTGLKAKLAVSAVIADVAVASTAYRLLVAHRLQQTAALFIGVPALLAIVIVFAVSPRSAVGAASKAVTVALLLSMLFLQEGILCVIMSAPLFYLVAIAIARSMETMRRHNATAFSIVLVLAIAPFSLEGVTPATMLDRDEVVSASKIVLASPEDVERALFLAPRFDRPRPVSLRAGFPAPVAVRILRDTDGMRWIVRLRGGEMYLNGMEPRSGDLVLALAEARPGLVRWSAVSDTSHMTHFLTWTGALVEWEPVDGGSTKVTWTLRYRRGLDPAWYFGPMERYAVRLAAGYLIDSVATP